MVRKGKNWDIFFSGKPKKHLQALARGARVAGDPQLS